MRRILLVTALLATGALLGNWLSPVAQADRGEHPGPQIAGSYLLDVRHEGFPPVMALVRLTSDGGFLSSDGSDFGADGLSTVNSPVYGAWESIGPREIKVRTLYIGFDPDDGLPVALARTTGTFKFRKGFRTGEGSLVVELFNPEQDPLDPEAEPFNVLNATLTARRIEVP